ncbi:MAG: hypothetical protein COA78_19710 [Blastopirellula sp.]|nr:MAG: hypothetical protein COA78_19710 [Blastopirellula sp.]
MPLVQSKATIAGSLFSVLIAPFALLYIGAMLNWWKLLTALIAITIAMTVFIILDQPGFFDLPPEKEIIDKILMIGVGTIAYVALVMTVSVPLAIRDCLVYQTRWEHDPDCLDAAREHFKLLLNEDYEKFYSQLTTPMRYLGTVEQFTASIKKRHAEMGRPMAVILSYEREIHYLEYNDRSYDKRIDAIVEIEFHSQGRRENNLCTFYLNCKEGYQIVKFEYSPVPNS